MWMPGRRWVADLHPVAVVALALVTPPALAAAFVALPATAVEAAASRLPLENLLLLQKNPDTIAPTLPCDMAFFRANSL
jgi:hypothetical protein